MTADPRRSALGRRALLVSGLAAPAILLLRRAKAANPVRFGLTPVFLDSDVKLLDVLERYLSGRLGRPVELVKRRTYQEITALLLSNQLDAAWICGFPFVQYRDRMHLLAVPVFRGRPEYQSYLITRPGSPARAPEDLRGGIHAFSDPDSNSGFLVTRHLLATLGERPDTFFAHSFYTYSHRNVIRAVASGLADSGSVDGYVWEVMKEIAPDLVGDTRVMRKSQWLGFPPVACAAGIRNNPIQAGIAAALTEMPEDPLGREVLAMLRLDGFVPGDPKLFDGIAALWRDVRDAA